MFFVNSVFLTDFSFLLAFDEAAIVATHAKSTYDSRTTVENCQKLCEIIVKKETENAKFACNQTLESPKNCRNELSQQITSHFKEKISYTRHFLWLLASVRSINYSLVFSNI